VKDIDQRLREVARIAVKLEAEIGCPNLSSRTSSSPAMTRSLTLPATAMKASHHAAVETSGHATVEAV